MNIKEKIAAIVQSTWSDHAGKFKSANDTASEVLALIEPPADRVEAMEEYPEGKGAIIGDYWWCDNERNCTIGTESKGKRCYPCTHYYSRVLWQAGGK